ncbi:MAG TPA: protein-disulfide reductase DsbD domain-containing protein [Blastocatellia bacterium]|nr:protein-disulfide reductase DsbD domain-containing protein [Blastocatellia bacterium]
MTHRSILLVLFVLTLAVAASAQTSASVVNVRPEQAVYKIKQGAKVQIAIVLEIESGYHINSNRPGDDFLVATSLKLEPPAGLTTSRVVYPKALLKKFRFSRKPMSVFEGRVVLRATVTATAGLAGGTHIIRGALRVQACNDEKCLLPKNVEVSVPVEVM